MKYAFLIPIYNTISGRLLPQFLHLQDWCRNLDGEIFTVVGRTHVDARNWLCTDGGGYANPTKLIDRFYPHFLMLFADILRFHIIHRFF